ncbi:MAG: cupin domain-containing protein [Acidimicrobiales bacterium]
MTVTETSSATREDQSDRRDPPELRALYRDLAAAHLMPLWTQRDDLMPASPRPAGRPALWRWSTLYPLASRAGELVAVGRGGERRAIALANPGIAGEPYATATLWAAIQYLGPKETAPAHRHTQTAFRFVVEGEGVWTNVDGDAVAMRRGDLLLTSSWQFHEHHNTTEHPMAWIDGLDIPLVDQLDAGFFEFGSERLSTRATPARSYGERLWGHPGLRPLAPAAPARRVSPLAAYRWEHTDAALAEQLACEDEGVVATVEPGHAAVRFLDPSNGADALRTIRTEMHRLRAGTTTTAMRTVGSSVWQVFRGAGRVYAGEQAFDVGRGDLFAVPSWARLVIEAPAGRPEEGAEGIDLFRFGDEPVYEALGLDRVQRGDG